MPIDPDPTLPRRPASVVGAPVTKAVESSTQRMTAADLLANASYRKTLRPSATDTATFADMKARAALMHDDPRPGAKAVAPGVP